MIKKIIIVFLFMSVFNCLAEETIKAKINYTEATARIEAFQDVEEKIDKDFYQSFLKDPNYKENIELMENKKFIVENERYLCPFYFKNVLMSYSVTYDALDKFNFYYNVLGNLVRFDVVTNTEYPKKTVGYSRHGNLVNVTFEIDESEQFVYDSNGKLLAHWLGNSMLNKKGKKPKIMDIKRGDF